MKGAGNLLLISGSLNITDKPVIKLQKVDLKKKKKECKQSYSGSTLVFVFLTVTSVLHILYKISKKAKFGSFVSLIHPQQFN